MKATIIHNANAGSAKDIPVDELQARLKADGFFPVLKATDSEDDLDTALQDAQGLILAVGGDGTLRSIALRLIGRPGVEFAFIPAGTANNVAHAFGVEAGWEAVLAGLKPGRTVSLDVGKVTGPLGTDYFLEAFGAGVYADALASYDPGQGKSVLRSLGTMLDVLPHYEPQEWRLSLDGQEVSGKYVLLEVLNTPMTGPHLNLAPNADPTDGLLDVVLVAGSEKESLLSYARKIRGGKLDELPNVTVTRCTKVELVWTGFPLHIDSISKFEIEHPEEIRQARGVTPELRDERENVIAIEVVPGAIKLRLPLAVAEGKQ